MQGGLTAKQWAGLLQSMTDSLVPQGRTTDRLHKLAAVATVDQADVGGTSGGHTQLEVLLERCTYV